MLLRGLGKLVGLIVVAGGAGLLLGFGLSELSGDEDVSAPAPTGDLATTATARLPETATTATRSVTTSSATPPPRQDPLRQVRVRILGAVLRPAGSPSGERRRRARLTLRVRVQNRGDEPVAVARPVLRVNGARIRPDRRAETPETRLGELAVGETKAVTLRFELAGRATTTLTEARRARIVVAGRSRSTPIRVGSPVRSPNTAVTPATTETTS